MIIITVMAKKLNILLIAFLFIVGVSSCSKYAPLERIDEKGDGTFLKSSEMDNQGDVDNTGGGSITDLDEDGDVDPDVDKGITDADEEGDQETDKEN